MYTVLRIGGMPDQLEMLLKKLKERCPDLNPGINRANMLIVSLSQTPDSTHWADVADALERISALIAELGAGDIGFTVDTAFERKRLPDGGIAIDSLSVSHIALEAMARMGADFEATVYPVDESWNDTHSRKKNWLGRIV